MTTPSKQSQATKPISAKRPLNWQRLAVEFLSVFVAVLSAFALTNWNDGRRDRHIEARILTEIATGLEADLADIDINMGGHEAGIEACKYWRKIINGEDVDLELLPRNFHLLTRDFTSMQNTSGYETLKSKGLEIIKDDNLRTAIISLYELDYATIRKLEEEYREMQFFDAYFKDISRILTPYLNFDTEGQPVSIDLPLEITESDRRLLLSYIWKIEINRKFVLRPYQSTKDNVIKLNDSLTHVIDN